MQSSRQTTNGIAGSIVVVGLIAVFLFGNFSLFFVALAFASLIGAFGTPNPKSILGGLHSFTWLLVVAAYFTTGSGFFFLVGAFVSVLLAVLSQPITTALSNSGLFNTNTTVHRPPQPPHYYPSWRSPIADATSPEYSPSQPHTETSYEQGYRAPQRPAETYREGGQEYQYPSPSQQYEQPQAQYPQQLPPQ